LRRLTDMERQLMGIARTAPLSEEAPNRVPVMEDTAATPVVNDYNTW